MKEIKNLVQQSGVVLLLILLLVLLLSTSILLARFNHTDSRLARQQHTAQVLARAKAALLGFAATYAEDPDHKGQPQGYLPCPDFNGDGSSPYSASTDTSCGNQGYSMIGRLPWRTLGLPPLRDGDGECLWYAVSGSYKDRPKQTLTSDDHGLFVVESPDVTIAGTSASTQAIAVVFAAGAPTIGQDRSRTGTATECGSASITDNVNQPSHYLDSLAISRLASTLSNATGTGQFSYQPAGTASGIFTAAPADIATFVSASLTKNASGQVIFNDSLAVITPKDFEPVYRRMNEWVAERVTQCLINYNSTNKTNFLNTHKDILGNWQTPDPGTYRATYAPQIEEYVQRSVTYCKYSKCNTIQQCKQLCVEIEDDCKSECQDATCEQTCEDEATSCQHDCGSSIATCETNCENNADNYKKNAIDVSTAYPWATTRVDGTTGDYADEAEVRFGRVPLQLTQTLGNNQQMKSVWSSLDGKTCFDTTSGLTDYGWGWWNDWKEMVFYAVDDNYTPSITTHFWLKTQRNAVKNGTTWELDNTNSSYSKESTLAKLNSSVADGWSTITTADITPLSSTILQLNTDSANFIILNSGRKLATQSERTDKLDITNYLEAGNQTTVDQRFDRSVLDNSFNDVACRNTRADCKNIPKGDNL